MMRRVPVILSTLEMLRRQPLYKLKLYSWDISQQHSYLTPAWESMPQELCAGASTTWQRVAAYQAKMFLLPSQKLLGNHMTPGRKNRSFNSLKRFPVYDAFMERELYPREWPQAVTISNYLHDQVFAGSQPQGLLGVQQW